MAQKVKWTYRSIADRIAIYQYWLQRNQSDSYPERLEQLFERSADLISNFPYIGTKTNYRRVYSKVVGNYKIFYRLVKEEIQILRVWDARQHPDSIVF